MEIAPFKIKTIQTVYLALVRINKANLYCTFLKQLADYIMCLLGRKYSKVKLLYDWETVTLVFIFKRRVETIWKLNAIYFVLKF